LKTQGNEFNSKFTITICIEMIIIYICNYERSVFQLLDHSGFGPVSLTDVTLEESTDIKTLNNSHK